MPSQENLMPPALLSEIDLEACSAHFIQCYSTNESRTGRAGSVLCGRRWLGALVLHLSRLVVQHLRININQTRRQHQAVVAEEHTCQDAKIQATVIRASVRAVT